MQPRRLLFTICTVLTLTLATSANAKDLNGRFGIGLEQSLSGVSGVTVRYWPSETFGILATVGADIVTQTDFKFLNTTVVASTGIMYNFAESLHANLGAGIRFAIGYETGFNAEEEADTGNVEFDIEIPLMTEFFMSDNFSVSLAVGVLFAFVPAGGRLMDRDKEPPVTDPNTEPTTTDEGETVQIGIGAVTGNIGVVYYF